MATCITAAFADSEHVSKSIVKSKCLSIIF
jgi:hypothetical protein